MDGLDWAREAWTTGLAWVAAAPLVVLIAAMVLGPLVGAPVSPFWLLIGLRLGPAWGTLAGMLGLSATISLSHLIGHSVLRPWLIGMIGRRWPTALQRLESLGRGWGLLWVCRCTPLPFAVQNYTLAIAEVPLSRNLAVSVPVLSLHLLAFIWLGDALATGALGPWVAGLGLLVLAMLVGRQLRQRILKQDALESGISSSDLATEYPAPEGGSSAGPTPAEPFSADDGDTLGPAAPPEATVRAEPHQHSVGGRPL